MLPHIPLGHLHHTNSTIMRQNGVEDSVIADYHGHVDPGSVDQQHYLMPTNEVLDDAAYAFGDAIQHAHEVLHADDNQNRRRRRRR